MTISEFISTQQEERQELLSQLHEIIVQKDKTVTPVIAPISLTFCLLFIKHPYKVSFNHLLNSLCHTNAFCGFNTQWFSSGKYISLLFNPSN